MELLVGMLRMVAGHDVIVTMKTVYLRLQAKCDSVLAWLPTATASGAPTHCYARCPRMKGAVSFAHGRCCHHAECHRDERNRSACHSPSVHHAEAGRLTLNTR